MLASRTCGGRGMGERLGASRSGGSYPTCRIHSFPAAPGRRTAHGRYSIGESGEVGQPAWLGRWGGSGSPTCRRLRNPPMNLTIADMMSSSTFLRMPTPYQNVVDQLDLAAALTNGSERNDLLLPRAEDKVGGEVGNRFLQALIRDLERGRYDPAPAYTVRVPKSTSATRPAALLTLNDRVVYAALVATLRSRIDSYLLGEEIVFWPRGLQRNKSWLKFEHSPLTDSCKYVVLADVSGFYESVDHRRLAERLIRATGKRAEVEALSHFLTRVMGGSGSTPFSRTVELRY